MAFIVCPSEKTKRRKILKSVADLEDQIDGSVFNIQNVEPLTIESCNVNSEDKEDGKFNCFLSREFR